MIISDFAIKRPLITVVAMVAMVIFGLFALFKLKTDEFPDVNPPFLTVGIVYPGASPDVVESEVLKPVEEQIGSISGVKRIMGKAYDGYSMVMIEFFFDKDLNVASQEVRDAISTIRSDLPTEMKEPIVQKFNDTDRPIVSLAISSTVLSPAGADAARRSRHHARAARASGRRRRADLRQGRARADGRSRPAQAPGGEHQRRRGRAGAPVAEPRRAGGPGERRSRRTRDSLCAGVSRIRRSSRTSSSPTETGRSCGSGRSRRSRTRPRSRARSRSTTARRRSASTSRRRRATARPTSPIAFARVSIRSSRRCPRARNSTW